MGQTAIHLSGSLVKGISKQSVSQGLNYTVKNTDLKKKKQTPKNDMQELYGK